MEVGLESLSLCLRDEAEAGVLGGVVADAPLEKLGISGAGGRQWKGGGARPQLPLLGLRFPGYTAR